MIKFSKTELENGLKVIVHEDHSTPLVALNILYDAGSKYEDPEKTGLAHLMEHLMFSGSVNIPDFDTNLQLAGGENNAWTNNDITDFYLTVPVDNLETALWLESDRMIGLDLTEKSLEVQRKVVMEEFRQRYLNQPYGDTMLLLRPSAYERHPYRWPAIGMDLGHIEKIGLPDIIRFFETRYSPDNAILSIAGNIEPEKAFDLCEKWFGGAGRRLVSKPVLPAEPDQKAGKVITVERDVPHDLLYKAWHVCHRDHPDFRSLDLLTDILAGGESGRLHEKLVREKKLFSEVNAYLTGDIDPGLLLFYGKLMTGCDMYKAEEEVIVLIEVLKRECAGTAEIEKIKNRFESVTLMSNLSALNKAVNLSFFELLGDAEMINAETSEYLRITPEEIRNSACRYMSDERCTTLYYKSSHRPK